MECRRGIKKGIPSYRYRSDIRHYIGQMSIWNRMVNVVFCRRNYHGWPSTQPGTCTQPCPHCSHSRAPIVNTAVPRENNEHGCVYLRCRAVCKLPGCVEGHPWLHGIEIDPTSAVISDLHRNGDIETISKWRHNAIYIETMSKWCFYLEFTVIIERYLSYLTLNDLHIASRENPSYRYRSDIKRSISPISCWHRMVYVVSTMGFYLVDISAHIASLVSVASL